MDEILVYLHGLDTHSLSDDVGDSAGLDLLSPLPPWHAKSDGGFRDRAGAYVDTADDLISPRPSNEGPTAATSAGEKDGSGQRQLELPHWLKDEEVHVALQADAESVAVGWHGLVLVVPTTERASQAGKK